MDGPRLKVVVIGAGAAGLIAAWRAAQCGARVLLLEKTTRLGTKILISGGGKCNITHDGPLEDVLRAFRPNEARFIRPACYRFTNQDVVKLLTDRGLRVYTRPDGRIFPVDQTAKDVVAILAQVLREVGVEVRRDCPVLGIEHAEGAVTGVRVATEVIPTDRVILATGGSSYPNSGTTGDGWPWVRELGHTVVKVRAALAPMYLALDRVDASLSGVAFRDCVLKVRHRSPDGKAKEIDRWRGDLLLTHHGVSGPCALGVSRVVAEQRGPCELFVDILPDEAPEALSERILESCRAHPRRAIHTWLEGEVPERLAAPILASAGVGGSTMGASLERRARNRLVETMKAWGLGPVRAVPLEKGEVVAGGVSLDEVDPHTMASRVVRGLYLCGEVLDVAGPVGGYNLQAAFATGYVAGESAARG